MRELGLTVHSDITRLELLWHIGVTNLVGSSAHQDSGDDHVMGDGDGF